MGSRSRSIGSRCRLRDVFEDLVEDFVKDLHMVAKFINNASGAMGPLCLWQCLDILVGPSFDSDTQHQQASIIL